MASPLPPPDNAMASALASSDLERSAQADNKFFACIILLSLLSRDQWIGAIADEAGRNGLTLVLEGQNTIDTAQPLGSTILVTSDPAIALAPLTSRRVVVLAGQATAAQSLVQEQGLGVGDSIIAASGVLADASQLPEIQPITTVYGRPGEVVRLWDGFVVEAPVDVGHTSDAVSISTRKAFEIYDNGAPRVGAHTRWDPPLFIYDQTHIGKRSKAWEIDITGPARALLFGPYLSLPPGVWRSRARFLVDEDAASHRFQVEWGTREAYTSEVFVPGRPGLFEISLDYEWTEVFQAELRFLMIEGSLNGTFEFLGTELEKMV